MQNKKAFSFIEVIVVISILALLAVVGLSMQGASKQKTQNAKAVGDIQTLNNSFQSYFTEKKTLPNPQGNINYFGSGSEYVHVDKIDADDISKSFGKHGFVTENILPKKYLNYLPLDPRTSQYYAYGKTTDSHFFEIAGVLKINGANTASVSGNYPGDNGPYNLIKEYNGPNFVSNNSTVSFPYNPDEKILVAKIDSYSDSSSENVEIRGTGYIISGVQLLEHTLVEGDTIIVPQNAQVNLYYSDGSQSTLGDSTNETKLVLANMEYTSESNLITRIQLALESGTIWTKATSLNTASEFEIYSQDTSASVRGTIFGVTRQSATNSTIVMVDEGEVVVKKVPTATDIIKEIEEGTIKPLLESLPTTTTITSGGNQNTTNDTLISTPIIKPVVDSLPANINFEIETIDIDTTSDSPTVNIVIPTPNISSKINKIAILEGNKIYLSNVSDSPENITLSSATQFQELGLGFSESVKQRNTLKLDDVTINTDIKKLSDIISTDSEIYIYLCLFTESKGKLMCRGEKSIKVKGGQLNYNSDDTKPITFVDDDGINTNEVKLKEEPVVAILNVPTSCDMNGTNIDLGSSMDFYKSETVPSGESCSANKITIACNSSGQLIRPSNYDLTYVHTNCTTEAQEFCPAQTINGYALPKTNIGETTDYIKKDVVNLIAYKLNTPRGKNFSKAQYKCVNGDSDTYSFQMNGVEQTGQIECDEGYSEFKMGGTTYCELKANQKELYAFAPYDVSNDIKMYNETGGSFGKNSSYIIQNCWFSNAGHCGETISSLGATTYDKDKSFATYENGKKGIFIDNEGLADFVKYSSLNLGDDYVIEIGVRGEDLKRTATYILFHIPGKMKVYTYSNKLFILTATGLSEYKMASVDDEFIALQLTSNSVTVDGVDIPKFSGSDQVFSSVASGYIYIGGTSGSSDQWNSIIDYVKIYN